MNIEEMKNMLPKMSNSLEMTEEEWELFRNTYEHVLTLVDEHPCNEAQELMYRRMCAFMWHAGKIYQKEQ